MVEFFAAPDYNQGRFSWIFMFDWGGGRVSTDPARPPFLLVLYQQYLDHQDSAAFARKVLNVYTTGTLERWPAMPAARFAGRLCWRWVFWATTGSTTPSAAPCWTRTAQFARLPRTAFAPFGAGRKRSRTPGTRRHHPAKCGPTAQSGRCQGNKIHRTGPLVRRSLAPKGRREAALGRLVESIRDCHQALEINPYHFVAATSMGQAYLQLDNPVSALECFRRRCG